LSRFKIFRIRSRNDYITESQVRFSPQGVNLDRCSRLLATVLEESNDWVLTRTAVGSGLLIYNKPDTFS